ncbi:hypothetical protein [Novosphingobium sp. ES2-1]|uniref:hypothetical protein n=1 Tax=Novosphingobium sp. ES2-1 TaxID=2780074 RepID=UPI001E3EF072|nr:hypothetical protein [Novosphingobium sp. ES2-1]
MSEPAAKVDLEQLRAMLLIAPFHQWLGLDIAELTDEALILEMAVARGKSSPTR